MEGSNRKKCQTSSATPKSSKTSKRGRFSQLIADILHKRSRQGLIEIDRSHDKYDLAVCMQEGLSWSPEAILDVEKSDLRTEDFSEVVEAKLINKDAKTAFLFKSYAPKVFLCLRRNLDISEDFYQESLGLDEDSPQHQQKLFLQFLSNSKSGQDFFLSNNKCYMIKTDKKIKDALFFLKILPKYFDHLEKYPHSLLVRYLGLHFIQIRGQKGRFFTVMQSVFYPEERIRRRYDIKGCIAQRYESPAQEDSEIGMIPVLKDINFKDEVLQLGSQKHWFYRQLNIDGSFMEDINVMDYSLLVGYHKLHPSEVERNNNVMSDVVLRVSKSFKFQQANKGFQMTAPESNLSNGKPVSYSSYNNDVNKSSSRTGTYTPSRSNNDTELTTLTHRSDSAIYSRNDDHHKTAFVRVNSDSHSHQQQNLTSQPPIHQSNDAHNGDISVSDSDNSILPGVVNSQSTASLLDGTVQDGGLVNSDISASYNSDTLSQATIMSTVHEQVTQRNLRYLPNHPNAIHIIDGPNKRYYFGMIDILTEYTAKKKAEHILKSILHPNISFSTVNPSHYNKRFCEFFYSHCE